MASYAAVISPPPPKPLNPDIDNDQEEDDEDIEYEEIEVEEEVEVEVEEEIETEEEIDEEAEVEAKYAEERGDDEIGEDLTPLREEIQEIDMELEEDEEHIQSVSVTQRISVANPLNDIPTTQKDVGHVKTSKSSDKEELHVNGERTSRDNDPKAPFYGSGQVNHAKRIPLGGDVDAALIMADASREKDNVFESVTGETNHTTTEALADIRQMSPRLHLPQVRFREPSPSAEFDRENKKLKIICEFHAKGWCIKGNSCRFLHVKDGLDAAEKKSEALERQASSSACVLPQQIGENPKLNYETEKLHLRNDDELTTTPLEDGRGSFVHNLYFDNYRYSSAPLTKGSLIERNSTYNGNFPSCSVTSHDSHHITRISAFGTSLEEMISKKNDIVRSDPRSADLPYSHSWQLLSFGSSSWNTDALGTQNLLKSGSLQRNISPAPCSESESLLRNHIFRDKQPDKSKSKSSSDYWEPSVPFRPSHAITQNLLMKENLYDPIHDGIEQIEVKDGRVKFSHSDQGSSVKNVNVQSNSSQKEERLLDSVHDGDNVKDNILSSSCDNKLKFDEQRHKTVVKVDGSGKNEETDADFKRDGHMQNETKALKSFQSELIELVKELVRPTWHEGLISRDAHKVIVKKTVDKVLSTLQPNQIPSTGESIKLYLSSSRPKLAKLVEAYIDKYGKS